MECDLSRYKRHTNIHWNNKDISLKSIFVMLTCYYINIFTIQQAVQDMDQISDIN